MPERPEKEIGFLHLVRYLAAHKMRLFIGLISMFMVGFFGSFNFLLIKPALEVILGGGQPRKTITIAHAADDGTTSPASGENQVRLCVGRSGRSGS